MYNPHDPWLTIIGLGEDGPSGLSDASRKAIENAKIIIGGPRHLALIGAGARGVPWPVPFEIDPVLAARGQKTVVLASGDPFWYGAGGSLLAHLSPEEWVCHPAPSCFQWATNALGWRMEETLCFGLHARPLTLLRPHLQRGRQILATLKGGESVAELAHYLTAQGHDQARLFVLERLGGPLARISQTTPAQCDGHLVQAPVMAAIIPVQRGMALASGLDDGLFHSDGQITKQPVRALTLSALAPRLGEQLWDLGAGSGSVSVEWCLAGGRSAAVEARADRIINIRRNIHDFGLAHLMSCHEMRHEEALPHLPRPDAVFIGGGANEALLTQLWPLLPPETRLVINAVTLETESLLYQAHRAYGGSLMRIDLATSKPLGSFHAWHSARPVVQWCVTKCQK